ncbi:MAG: glycosyltransferase family 4 protein [Oscillospiraceae bacterium]|nr:glycosyltransferase family 4 protein [Oscillospiraceae bacterium]
MRFLFFCAQYLPTVGGVERYTYNLCKTLSEMGHSSTIVTSQLEGLAELENSENISIVRLPSYMLLNGRFPLLKRNSSFKSLMNEVFSSDYDMAIINTRFYPLSLYGAKQCHRRGISAIVIEHGSSHLSLGNHLVNVFVRIYEHLAIGVVKRYCKDFYGVSISCQKWLEHFRVKSHGVIYNAIDPEAINETAKSSALDIREKLCLTDEAVVVFSGRFLKEKGIYELLDAFKMLAADNSNAVLVMAGNGPLFQEVESKKPPNVHLVNQLSFMDSLALLKQADIFILPTYSEGFSTVTLEAAALGKCIISTPTGGNPELIQHMHSGMLLETVSPKSILSALQYALNDEAFRDELGCRVQQIVQEKFNWKSSANKLLMIAGQMGNQRT